MANLVGRLLRRLGYELRPKRSPYFTQQWLLDGKTNPVVLDVGAHRGRAVRRYLELFPQASIHAFEPQSAACQELRRLFANDDRVRVVEAALSDCDGSTVFHLNGSEVQSSLLNISAIGSHSYLSHVDSVEVPTIRIDKYLESVGIQDVDILKMDVQGAERIALEGGSRTLAEGRISLVYLEAWFKEFYEGSGTFADISQLLSSHDYSLYHIFNLKEDSNRQAVKVDALFISEGVQSLLNSKEPYWYSSSRIKAKEDMDRALKSPEGRE